MLFQIANVAVKSSRRNIFEDVNSIAICTTLKKTFRLWYEYSLFSSSGYILISQEAIKLEWTRTPSIVMNFCGVFTKSLPEENV